MLRKFLAYSKALIITIVIIKYLKFYYKQGKCHGSKSEVPTDGIG